MAVETIVAENKGAADGPAYAKNPRSKPVVIIGAIDIEGGSV
jgi:hypothetical protein